MTSPTPDDELLAILLRNFRNAAATFGEGTPPCENIRTTIEDHLKVMKSAGAKTNLTGVNQSRESQKKESTGPSMTFSNLAFRPKPENANK